MLLAVLSFADSSRSFRCSPLSWLSGAGAALLLLYLGLFNRQLYLVWIFVAVLIMIEQLANALVYSQPFYWLGMGLSMAMIALVAWSMTRAFMRTLTDK
jgi:hypothetical protein